MAQYARDICEEAISKELPPIPAILDHRYKDALSLTVKMKEKYGSCVDCKNFLEARVKYNIPDLAAIRISLLYPSQKKEVKMLLERVFEVRNAQTTKKLSGYEADHYLVRFRDNKPLDNRGAALFEQQEDDVVEVQVVTIFAHTWSQVEHKLKYKRKTYTPLSTTENRMLQGLSGVVATGDYLLDELYTTASKKMFVHSQTNTTLEVGCGRIFQKMPRFAWVNIEPLTRKFYSRSSTSLD